MANTDVILEIADTLVRVRPQPKFTNKLTGAEGKFFAEILIGADDNTPLVTINGAGKIRVIPIKGPLPSELVGAAREMLAAVQKMNSAIEKLNST